MQLNLFTTPETEAAIHLRNSHLVHYGIPKYQEVTRYRRVKRKVYGFDGRFGWISYQGKRVVVERLPVDRGRAKPVAYQWISTYPFRGRV